MQALNQEVHVICGKAECDCDYQYDNWKDEDDRQEYLEDCY